MTELSQREVFTAQIVTLYRLAKTADSSCSHVLSKVFNRLATHPFSYRFKDFIHAYRVENAQLKSTTEFLQPQFDERGNAYVEMFGELRDQ